jgi:glycosyltransferase involved in cell wall biosynthesis
VDTEHFCDRSSVQERQALRQTLGFAKHDYVIAISAVLRPEKNHLQLLNALATLRQMGIPARLLMIGDGPLRPALEARCTALKLQDSVQITGFVGDVRPYLAACDVKVLCSLSETFSLAALEAMAMGKPVIHSDVGGASEMIFPGKNGYLFPVGHDGELVSRLLTLSDPKLAQDMGRQARQVVESRFSEKCMVDRYEAVLLECCAQPADLATENPLQPPFKGGVASEIQLKQGSTPHENL